MDLKSNWAFVEYEARSISATYIRHPYSVMYSTVLRTKYGYMYVM